MLLMGFVDLGFVGSRFTWSNRRSGMANIRERIDRGIANLQWRVTFPDARIQHSIVLPIQTIDLLFLCFLVKRKGWQRISSFNHSGLGIKVVLGLWRKLGEAILVVIHLGLCSKRSKQLEGHYKSGINSGNIQESISRIKGVLEIIQDSVPSDESLCMVNNLLLALDEQLYQEEYLWK